MSILFVIGPSAIGKTTAVRRWCQRYKSLVGIHADKGVELIDGVQRREIGWKKDARTKQELVNAWRWSRRTVGIESAAHRAAALLEYISPDDWLLALVCSVEAQEEWLRERCKKTANGKVKRFRDEYWTPT